MPLPIGFFMPLPLPIMIPFMMWQSAAIAAGFGTYFQFAKRRVSAMSNEEFNKSDPHQLVNSMYEDIVKQIPSSFAKVDDLTPVMLQSMNVMLDQAVKWLQGAITGNIFGTPNPVNTTQPAIGSDGTTEFIPDQAGQASIPSVNWLNNLSREQLKAIRNDALRGDYNEDSTTLILARYKQIFAFDRNASLPAPNPQNPIAQLAPTGTFTFTQSEMPDIHRLHIQGLNDKIKRKDWAGVSRKLSTLYSSSAGISRNTNASSTQKAKGAREVKQLGKAIVRYNKWSQANL